MVRLLEIQQFSSCALWELSREISVQFATLALLKGERKWGILGVLGAHRQAYLNVWSLYAWKAFEVEGNG